MTIKPYSAVLTTANNMVTEAKKKGLSASKPIRISILGSNTQVDYPPKREVIISYGQPPISKFDFELWVNPLNMQTFRSNPYSDSWDLVLNYDDLFTNPASASAGGGSTSLSQPVDAVSDLTSLNTTNIPDRTMIYVEAEKAIYALDLQSTDPVSPGVLAPDVGPGRWYVISTQSGTLGNIDGGVY